ncbi:hypothetical protein Tco_0689120 [Tanacetum coccineum]
MPDSDESGVTHMEISNPFEDLSDIGSPGVVGPEHEGLPWMLDDPYMQEDELFLAEEQPLPAAASPTAQSPNYVPESDPGANPEKDDDEDLKEDPVDYPADGGDDGDDEDESSEDDEDDDKVDIEADDDEEEEEHPAPADSVVVALPAVDQASSAEETESFKTDESAATPPPDPAYHVTARISIPAPVPTPVWSDAEVARLLAISTPPSSPLSPCPIRLLGYRAAMIWLRVEAASTSHSLPLPPLIILSHTRPTTPSLRTPPLHLLSTNCREDRPEVTLPPQKRLGIALGPAYEVGESSSAAAARPAGRLRADYGFFAAMDREIRGDPERDVGYGITDSWDEIVETLQGHQDRRALARTARLIETEARMSREAWGRSMDASDLERAEVNNWNMRLDVLESRLQGLSRVKKCEESWALIEDLALYDNESCNDPRDFAKPIKAISLPHDVPNTSDCHLIELENQVQRLMEAYLAPKPSIQVNKIAYSYARLSKFEADFKQQQSEITIKIDTFLKAINDRMMGALPSDMVKNSKLNVNPTSLVLSARSYPIVDPQSSSNPFKSVNAIKTCFKPANDFQKDQLQVKTLKVN